MFKRISEQNHYQVLEVPYDATPQQIQAAYDMAREVYRMDSLAAGAILTHDERRSILERVGEAYRTLIAEESRRFYDERLARTSDEIRELLASTGERKRLEREHAAPPSLPRPVRTALSPSGVGAPPSSRRQTTSGTSASPSGVGARLHVVSRLERPRSRPTLGEKEEATGEFLRRAREAAGIDIRTIAEETKIGATTIGYIEEERVERLPALVYLRSFVVQYARCLGLEAERVAASYIERIKRLAVAVG